MLPTSSQKGISRRHTHALTMELQYVTLNKAPQFQMVLNPEKLEPPAVPQEEHLHNTQLHNLFDS